MANTFNLKKIFAEQFGYAPAQEPFKVEENQLIKRNEDGQYGPYYANDLQGREVFMPVTIGGVFLPYTWMSIAVARTVIETPLTERRGSVKEQIQLNDYLISLKGLAIGQNRMFPEKEIEALKTLVERNETLDIKCPLTDIFLLTPERGGQDKVLIMNFNLNENVGKKHVRGYQMELISDQEFELEIL